MRDLSLTPLGRYNRNAKAAAIAIDHAAGYRPFVAVMPESAAATMPAGATYEPRVTVPVGSLLWAISGGSAQAAGFSLQVTDTATRKPLFSQAIKSADITGGAGESLPDCIGTAHTFSPRLHRLPRPMLVLSPGIVSAQLVNLASVANRLQACLHFAIPAGPGEPNEYNRMIWSDLAAAQRAARAQGSTGITSAAATAGGSSAPAPDFEDLLEVAFDVTANGDNTIIQGNSGGRIEIHALDLWNVDTTQTITFKSGARMVRGPLADYPGSTGYGLQSTGRPHFRLDPGAPFVIALEGGRVTGFIRYRIG